MNSRPIFWGAVGVQSLFLALGWLMMVWGVFPPQGNIYCIEGTVLTLSAFLLPPLQWRPGKCGDPPAFQPG